VHAAAPIPLAVAAPEAAQRFHGVSPQVVTAPTDVPPMSHRGAMRDSPIPAGKLPVDLLARLLHDPAP